MPNFSSEALKWLLQHTPSPAIYEIVKGIGPLGQVVAHGGFQLNSNSFDNPGLRLRLAALLQRDKDLLATFLDHLQNSRCWQTACRAVRLLNQDWLKKNWRIFLRTVEDPRPWVMGLYWESKDNHDEKTARLCHLLFACPSLWQEPACSRQDAELLSALNLFATKKMGDSPKKEPVKQAGHLQKLQQENAALHKKLEQVRKESRERQRTEGEQLQNCQQKITLLEHDLKSRELYWQEQYQQLSEGTKEQVRSEIAAFQQRVAGLQPDQEKQFETIRNGNLKLQERIEKLLQHQAEMNRRFGLRQELRREITNLEDSLQNIQRAIDESVVVSDDLPILQSEVEERINQLRDRLKEDDSLFALKNIPNRMKALIKTVRLDDSAPRIYMEIMQFLDHEYMKKLLQPGELQAIRELLDEQRKTHNHMLTSLEATKAAHRQPGEIWFLTQHIQDFHRVRLFIDGCNLLLSDPQWKEITQKQGQAAARADILEKCRSKATLFRGIHLIFDGIEFQDSIEKNDAGLTLHFAARKQNDQNADNYLVNMLSEMPRAERELRWVITKDTGLLTRVAHLCDACVPNESFAQFLRNR